MRLEDIGIPKPEDGHLAAVSYATIRGRRLGDVTLRELVLVAQRARMGQYFHSNIAEERRNGDGIFI